jgi:hypothetical protein
MLETLRSLQNLLSHQIPDGNEVKILERALSALLREVEKQKLAATDKPRASRPTRPGSRHIPAEVKRAVWARDGGRCAFVGENGHRCTARRFLQWHHVHPHGDGGPTTIQNIEMRCRRHNRYESDQYYGPHFADCEPEPHDLERVRCERERTFSCSWVTCECRVAADGKVNKPQDREEKTPNLAAVDLQRTLEVARAHEMRIRAHGIW